MTGDRSSMHKIKNFVSKWWGNDSTVDIFDSKWNNFVVNKSTTKKTIWLRAIAVRYAAGRLTIVFFVQRGRLQIGDQEAVLFQDPAGMQCPSCFYLALAAKWNNC